MTKMYKGVLVDECLWRQVKVKATKEQKTLSQVVTELLESYVGK